MTHADSRNVIIGEEQFVLLDKALRLAYTHLIDKRVAGITAITNMRNLLISAIVAGIEKGESDEWRLARRALFASYALLAQQRITETGCV